MPNTRERDLRYQGTLLPNTRKKRPPLAGKTHIGRKENPEIMDQFYLKGLYVLLNLDYTCLCL